MRRWWNVLHRTTAKQLRLRATLRLDWAGEGAA